MGRYAEAETVYREVLDVPEPNRSFPIYWLNGHHGERLCAEKHTTVCSLLSFSHIIG
jgi:hypothetical protein